jgi:hypothetical protein
MRRNTSGHPAPRVQDTVRPDIGGARRGPLSRPAPPRVRSRRCPKQQSLPRAQLGLRPACPTAAVWCTSACKPIAGSCSSNCRARCRRGSRRRSSGQRPHRRSDNSSLAYRSSPGRLCWSVTRAMEWEPAGLAGPAPALAPGLPVQVVSDPHQMPLSSPKGRAECRLAEHTA